MAREITEQQERFCIEYVVDFNGQRAAEAAGYSKESARVQASRLLTRDNIVKKIKELQQESANKCQVTIERWREEAAHLAFADFATFATIEPGGQLRIKPFEELPSGATRCIKKIREKRTIRETDNGEVLVDQHTEFELHDKVKSIDMLGKHLGAYVADDAQRDIAQSLRGWYQTLSGGEEQ